MLYLAKVHFVRAPTIFLARFKNEKATLKDNP